MFFADPWHQAPSGLTCTKVNSDGEVTCDWSLTDEQMNIESHSFCYDATDSVGLVTPRQCLTMENLGSEWGLDEVPRMKECLEVLKECNGAAEVWVYRR